MNIAIVTFPSKQDSQLKAMANEMSRALASRGHSVTEIDGGLDAGKKLGMYQYVFLGADVNGFFGKSLPKSFRRFFDDAGSITGKKVMVFIRKTPFFCQKGLATLMTAVEKEGLLLHNQEIFPSVAAAKSFASRYEP